MKGLMQHWPMLIHRIIDHAAVNHRGARIVTRALDGKLRHGSYDQARGNARRLAAALAARGIRPGDRVATLAWNNQDHLECWYGITGIGAVYHTLNPRLHPDQLAWIAHHGGARALIFDACFADLVAAIAPRLRHVEFFVAMGGPVKAKLPKKLFAYDDFIADRRERDWTALDENDACGLCYTSGTTGDPRGVLYSHRSNMLLALVAAQTPALRMGPQDVILPMVPMFHANFWGLNFVAPMTGASLVLPGPRPDPATLYDLLTRERVTMTAGVPTVWLGLLQYLAERKLKLPHLKRVVIGGAAAPRAMIRTFEDRHGVEVIHCWGMTELSPIGTMAAMKPPQHKLPPDRRLDAKARQGWPQFGIEMKITTDSGKTLPRDGKSVGRLKVRGPAAARGYFRGAGKDAFDAHGWFDTGDVATLDGDGVMAITDRSKDVIKSGGEWISSVTLENLAMGHPQIAEAAVIGIAHPKWGERPLLVAVKKPRARVTGPQLLGFLKGKVAKWWLPDAVVFVAEIPHTAAGKIRKTQLRAQLAGFKFPS